MDETPRATVELPTEHSSYQFADVLSELANAGSTVSSNEQLEYWKSVNPATFAMIECDDLDICLPVLEANDNNQWLRTNIYGQYEVAGTVFMDYRCDLNATPIKILHGHNMKNGTMFHNLPTLLELESCEDAPLFKLITDKGEAVYKVFAVLSVDSKAEAFPIEVLNDYEGTLRTLEDLKERSWVPGGTVDSLDTLVLNTCWYGESGVERNLHCLVCTCRIS